MLGNLVVFVDRESVSLNVKPSIETVHQCVFTRLYMQYHLILICGIASGLQDEIVLYYLSFSFS